METLSETQIAETLRAIALFSDLDEEQLNRIIASSALQRKEKGSVLFREGDPYHGFYVVFRGKVKVSRVAEDGKETILHVVGAGQTLAEIPMFSGSSYPADATTIEDSLLLAIPKESFLELLSNYPPLAMQMLARLSGRLREMGSHLEGIASLDVKTRLARYLLEESERQFPDAVQPHLVLPVTKSVLASQLGTVLETVSRALKKLETERLIKTRGRQIILEDIRELKRRYGAK